MKGTQYNFLQYILGNWMSINCNKNGSNIIAVNAYLPLNMIFLSTDYGSSWSNITGSIGNVNLSDACIDYSGNNISLAAIRHAYYVSNNSGDSWNEYSNNTSASFITSNSTGEIVLLAEGYGSTTSKSGSTVLLSTNYGSTTTTILENYKYNWSSVSMNSSGTTMIVTSQTGYCFLSTDSGDNWSQINIPIYIWSSSSIDETGDNLCLCSLDGYIYFSSNAGTTWESCAPSSLTWSCISISSSANVIFACAVNNNIYYSSNKGTSWNSTSPNNSPSNWSSITTNSDGTLVAACVNGGNIYIANTT
jgi:photosystem II stability/assembly factor-like uncharacterized protein